MKAFEIHLNGRYLLTTGVGETGVLSTIVTWAGANRPREAGGDLFLSAGGLDSATGEHVSWSTPAIAVGDIITIKAVEAEPARISPEHTRGHHDRARFQELANQMARETDEPAPGE